MPCIQSNLIMKESAGAGINTILTEDKTI